MLSDPPERSSSNDKTVLKMNLSWLTPPFTANWPPASGNSQLFNSKHRGEWEQMNIFYVPRGKRNGKRHPRHLTSCPCRSGAAELGMLQAERSEASSRSSIQERVLFGWIWRFFLLLPNSWSHRGYFEIFFHTLFILGSLRWNSVLNSAAWLRELRCQQRFLLGSAEQNTREVSVPEVLCVSCLAATWSLWQKGNFG